MRLSTDTPLTRTFSGPLNVRILKRDLTVLKRQTDQLYISYSMVLGGVGI